MAKRKRPGPTPEKLPSDPRADSDVIARPALGSLAALVVLAGQLAVFVYPNVWMWGLALTLFGLAMFLGSACPMWMGNPAIAGSVTTEVALPGVSRSPHPVCCRLGDRCSDQAPALVPWLAGACLLVARQAS
jgi:hypothetical protein